MANNLQIAFDNVVSALCQLEELFGDKYKLSFLARYTDSDLEDADMLVTSDDLDLVVAAVERRRDADA